MEGNSEINVEIKKRPAYQVIAEQLNADIKKGVYRTNDKLPCERELIQRFQVSRMTVRGALDHLINQGVLYRLSGKGAFVAPQVFHRSAVVRSFTSVMEEAGLQASNKLLFLGLVMPPFEVSAAFHINARKKVYKLTRLRMADNQAMAYEVAYLPPENFPGLEEFDFSKSSLYRVMEEAYEEKVFYVQEEVSAVHVKGEIARELYGVEEDIALLINGVSYNHSQEIIEFCYSYYHKEHYKYVNTSLLK